MLLALIHLGLKEPESRHMSARSCLYSKFVTSCC